MNIWLFWGLIGLGAVLVLASAVYFAIKRGWLEIRIGPKQVAKISPATKSDVLLEKKNRRMRSQIPTFITLLIVYLVLTLVGYAYTVENWKWWIPAIVASVSHFITAIKVVDVNEMAVTKLFGYFLADLKSGLALVPWPVKLYKVTKGQIHVSFGTLESQEDIELAQKSADSDQWFMMERPVRINWGDIFSTRNITPEDRKAFVNDPLAQRITTDPHQYLMMRVVNLRALIVEVGSLEAAIERIIATCITSLQNIAGKTYAAKATGEIDEISDLQKLAVETLVGDPYTDKKPGAGVEGKKSQPSWGLDILLVRVKDLGIPHRTNSGLVDRSEIIAKAQGNATATVLQGQSEGEKRERLAEARRVELLKEGEGNGAAEAALGRGRAQAMTAMAEAVSKPGGELIVRTEAWKAGLEHGKAVIVPADMSIMSGILSAQAALKATENKPTTPKE